HSPSLTALAGTCYISAREAGKVAPHHMKKRSARYRRILLKLSGEALGGEGALGIRPEAIHEMARQVREVRDMGVEVVIVVGGGNIFRGLQGSERGIERVTGDYMGLLGTVINA